MGNRKGLYQQLAEGSGWLSALLFVLGAIGKLTEQQIVFSSNDHWQGALYLALFAIFARFMAKE